MSGRVEAICVVYADIPQPRKIPVTAIDKRPVDGPTMVRALGVDGDHVCDTKHHGGYDAAVYAYAEEDAVRWSGELGKPIPAGWFGENLRVSGVAVSDAVIGARWRVGETLLEVTAPRIPCVSFQYWTGEEHWVRRFAERGDTGAYFRVLREGRIGAGDTIDIEFTPSHGVTVRDLFDGKDLERLALLNDEPTLSQDSRGRLDRALGRAAGIRPNL